MIFEKPLLYAATIALLVTSVYFFISSSNYKDQLEALTTSNDNIKYELTMCQVTNSLKDNRLNNLSGKIDSMQTRLDGIALSIDKDTVVTDIQEQPTPNTCDDIAQFLNSNLPNARFK